MRARGALPAFVKESRRACTLVGSESTARHWGRCADQRGSFGVPPRIGRAIRLSCLRVFARPPLGADYAPRATPVWMRAPGEPPAAYRAAVRARQGGVAQLLQSG